MICPKCNDISLFRTWHGGICICKKCGKSSEIGELIPFKHGQTISEAIAAAKIVEGQG